jgi:hypothetical protein
MCRVKDCWIYLNKEGMSLQEEEVLSYTSYGLHLLLFSSAPKATSRMEGLGFRVVEAIQESSWCFTEERAFPSVGSPADVPRHILSSHS